MEAKRVISSGESSQTQDFRILKPIFMAVLYQLGFNLPVWAVFKDVILSILPLYEVWYDQILEIAI